MPNNNNNNNNTNRSEHLTFGSLAICGISTSFILLATGISCLVISILQIISNNDGGVDNDGVDTNNNNTNTNNNDGVDDNNSSKPDCGSNGKPPLLNWVLGTGISFMIITCAFCRISSGKKAGQCVKLIMAVSNLFILIWGIVGIFSLNATTDDCKSINPTLYNMGVSAIIISFIVCCCGGFVGYKQQTIPVVEAVEVVEDVQDVQVAVAVAVRVDSSSSSSSKNNNNNDNDNDNEANNV